MSYTYMLKAHLILVTKYRKVLLVNNLNEQMKEIIYNISKKSKFIIEVMETDMNHLHMIISYPPTLSISSIVRKLKQESANKIWQLYEKDLQNEFWKEHTFWSDGYFVCSIGNASINTVKKYIEQQGN